MGRLRLFGELIEARGAVEGGGGGGGDGHQIARVVRTAGDYTTTSTTFADIDTSNLVIDMTTGGSTTLRANTTDTPLIFAVLELQ